MNPFQSWVFFSACWTFFHRPLSAIFDKRRPNNLGTWIDLTPVFSQPSQLKTENMATTVEEICPSEETLTQRESEASIQCPTPGCSRVFHNRPCLRMHLVKTHGVAANDEERGRYIRGQKTTVEKHYYCPVKHCVRGQGTKRPFPRMSQLKQVILSNKMKPDFYLNLCE